MKQSLLFLALSRPIFSFLFSTTARAADGVFINPPNIEPDGSNQALANVPTYEEGSELNIFWTTSDAAEAYQLDLSPYSTDNSDPSATIATNTSLASNTTFFLWTVSKSTFAATTFVLALAYFSSNPSGNTTAPEGFVSGIFNIPSPSDANTSSVVTSSWPSTSILISAAPSSAPHLVAPASPTPATGAGSSGGSSSPLSSSQIAGICMGAVLGACLVGPGVFAFVKARGKAAAQRRRDAADGVMAFHQDMSGRLGSGPPAYAGGTKGNGTERSMEIAA